MSKTKHIITQSPLQNSISAEDVSSQEKREITVLVLNANRIIANEITAKLAEHVEECIIVYAPTLELARLIIKKRPVNLIVSSPILPDGHITKLQPALESLSDPPDVVIFADLEKRSIELFESQRYHFLSIKQINSQVKQLVFHHTKEINTHSTEKSIQNLGAEIRDALNNPLQEIVSLIFVARSATTSLSTEHALNAIELAAQNMASLVWSLEDRLYKNVIG